MADKGPKENEELADAGTHPPKKTVKKKSARKKAVSKKKTVKKKSAPKKKVVKKAVVKTAADSISIAAAPVHLQEAVAEEKPTNPDKQLNPHEKSSVSPPEAVAASQEIKASSDEDGQVQKRLEEMGIMSSDTSQQSSAAAKGTMGFWPKVIVAIIIFIGVFMYIRSLAHMGTVTSTEEHSEATTPTTANSAPGTSLSSETRDAAEDTSTAVSVSPGQSAVVPAGTVETAEKGGTSPLGVVSTETSSERQAAATVVEEEKMVVEAQARQPVAPAQPAQTEAATAPATGSAEVVQPELEEQAASAVTAVEGKAQETSADAPAAASGKGEAAVEVPALAPAQTEPSPVAITPPARPIFSERMTRERPEPPVRPSFEERLRRDRAVPPAFSRDPIAAEQPAQAEEQSTPVAVDESASRERPEPPTPPSFEERFGRDRPMPQPGFYGYPAATGQEPAQAARQEDRAAQPSYPVQRAPYRTRPQGYGYPYNQPYGGYGRPYYYPGPGRMPYGPQQPQTVE